MTLEMSLFSVFQLLDTLWVGRLGAEELAALTVSSTLQFTLSAVAMGLGIGGTAMVARRIGEGDWQGANNACMQAVLMALMVSVVLSSAGLFLARPMLRLLGAPAEVIPLATAYLRITFAGLFATVMLPIMSSLLRGAGDAVLALKVRIVVIVVSIAMEPLLIFGPGYIPGLSFLPGVARLPALGIRGSALAMVLGRALGVALQLYILVRGLARIRLEPRRLHLDLQVIRTLLRIGIPGMVQRSFWSFSRLFLLGIISPFGTAALAGYGIANQMSRMVLILSWGMGNSTATLVGQNLGAAQPRRAERVAWITAGIALGISLAMSAPIFIFAPNVVRAFSTTPAVVEVGSRCLRILTISFALSAVGTIFSQGLSGAGDTMAPMFISILTLWAFQLPLAYLLSSAWVGWGTNGIWVGIGIASGVNGLMSILWFKRGRWKRIRV